MGVEKKLIKSGNGVDVPRKGDTVSLEYTGWLYDASQAGNDYRGNQFDSSVGRGDLVTRIGEGRVIKGLDEGILGSSNSQAMTLGEKATLTISSDFGYGDRDVELKAINGKRA